MRTSTYQGIVYSLLVRIHARSLRSLARTQSLCFRRHAMAHQTHLRTTHDDSPKNVCCRNRISDKDRSLLARVMPLKKCEAETQQVYQQQFSPLFSSLLLKVCMTLPGCKNPHLICIENFPWIWKYYFPVYVFREFYFMPPPGPPHPRSFEKNRIETVDMVWANWFVASPNSLWRAKISFREWGGVGGEN